MDFGSFRLDKGKGELPFVNRIELSQCQRYPDMILYNVKSEPVLNALKVTLLEQYQKVL